VVLRDGTRIGRLDHILKDMGNVREAQFYQEAPGAVVLRVCRAAGYAAADEERLLREARSRLGDSTEIAVEYHERIPRGATGKLRFVVSRIPSAVLDGSGEPRDPA
jgi:phenylacetate-CoA ligase